MLGVESILPGFPNLEKKMSKHLIKASVSVDHILEWSVGRWGGDAGKLKIQSLKEQHFESAEALTNTWI